MPDTAPSPDALARAAFAPVRLHRRGPPMAALEKSWRYSRHAKSSVFDPSRYPV